MYKDMEEWTEIRLRVLKGEATKREILRETGTHYFSYRSQQTNPSHSRTYATIYCVSSSHLHDIKWRGAKLQQRKNPLQQIGSPPSFELQISFD